MHIKDEIGLNKGDKMVEKERFGELCQNKNSHESKKLGIEESIITQPENNGTFATESIKHVDTKHFSTTLTKSYLDYYIKFCMLLRNLSSIETCEPILQNQNEIKAEKGQVLTQIPRGFKEDPSEEYCEGYILSQPESDGTLATRCFEFKYFADCVKNSTKNVLIKFLIELLKFSCGCLNKRRNGTICFGIADNCIKKNDYENYKHGEIVGFPLDNDGLNSEKMYTDALREAILLCFDDKSAAFAAKCISDPKFVKVNVGGNKCRYVMEVDVEASFMICTNLYFTVNPHKLKKSSFIESINIEKLGNKFLNTDKDFLFLRKGSSTERIENKSKQHFIKKTLLDLVVSRICFEIREPNFTLSKKFYHALQQIQRCYHTDSENCAFEIIRDILYYVVMPLKDHNGNATLVSAQDIPCSIEHNQNLRSFKESPDTRIYSKGCILIERKTNETIASRLMEFKNFDDCFENQEKNFLGIFVKDVLEFVDSCLNSRRFGTIYFGVEDIPLKNRNSKYKNVKLSGVNIDENNSNSRCKYTDALRNAISKRFPGHISDIVKECVSNPLFVKVKIPGKNNFSHVIEVDIDPSSIFCKRLSFTNQENERKRKQWQFVQEGSAIKKNENNVESSSINVEFTKLVKNRYSFELKEICHKIIDSKRKSENN